MSQPQFQFNEAGSFPTQVKEAIILAGFDCKIIKQETELFYQLIVSKSEVSILEIILIDLHTWKIHGLGNDYHWHFEKLTQLRALGRKAILLWQDQWERAPQIVISRIHAILGKSVRIPGRVTHVSRIDKKTTDEFLSRNHLQGNVSSKYRYGLYLPARYFRLLPTGFELGYPETDLLVAVATFSHVRIFEKNSKPFRSFELIRFANLGDTTVVGGLNKLLSAFERDFKPDDIMTYADLEWSDGASYRKLGFEAISDKPPMSFWVDEGSHSRYTTYDPAKDLTEVTNAGSRKFVKSINQQN
ncbi:hypothetical protein [Dyadobacter sp. CY312]|uniref:hypothetical protein n=1 Tax=Dyadobacter sp. CY312 TaxID=2907303 RepID=UPI001F260150|nr:hypothetical protein [Dyadobacter sp. CY312]MCE7039156.1 hypothetical protein [Dyadobacter sp. CY312]